MAQTKEQIIDKIKEYIKSVGGEYSQWYVGISEEPESRLKNGHNVSGGYIIRDAGTSTAAREIEEYFVDTLGTDGGKGGGDADAKYVYAYKKQVSTKE